MDTRRPREGCGGPGSGGGVARRGAEAASVLLLLLLPALVATAQEPALSPRQPLLDALAREEIDGYARLDQVMQQAAALPDVSDPGVYQPGTGTAEIRGRLLGYLLWLQGAQSSHLQRIESLPARLSQIDTREPYRDELIETVREGATERYRRLAEWYEGEIDAAELRIEFVEFIDERKVRAEAAGFVFAGSEDVDRYRDMLARMNAVASSQDARLGDYYLWEIHQKAGLRQFRDQL